MDEKKDKLSKIVVEIHPSIAAHAGELDEVLRGMLGELFHGLNIEEIKDETRHGIFATIYVDPGLDEREIEAVVEAVEKFAPRPVVVTPEPSIRSLLDRVTALEDFKDDFQRQLDELSAAIGKK